MESTDTFDEYFQEYCSLMQQIATTTDDEEHENLLRQCSDVLQQMALEARSLENPTKTELLERVKLYKSNLKALQEKSKRDRLFADSKAKTAGTDIRLERQLRQNEERVTGQNETLERALHSLQETEQVGLEITEELDRNRATIESTHENVHQVSSMNARANQILTSMTKWWRR